MATKFLMMCAALGLAGAVAAQDAAPETKPPTSRKTAAAEWTEDGLQQVKVKGLDLVYVAPGVDLKDFDQVMLGSISVAFSRGWERTPRPGSHFHWSKQDLQRIRERLATVLSQETVKVLTEGGHPVVSEAAEKVLRVDVAIANLNVTSPLPSETMGARVWGVSAGNMTLVAELSDSVSGEVLARAYDYAEARESRAHRINDAENESEARGIARNWAKILLAQLDGATQQP
jgi:hypothetical protein